MEVKNENESSEDGGSKSQRFSDEKGHLIANQISSQVNVDKVLRWLMKPWNPYSPGKVCWDTLGFALVIHDIIAIPLDVAWVRNKTTAEDILFNIMITFWTLDIALTFNTGYLFDGQIQYSRLGAARHYAKTWLAFDTLIVIIDWIFWIMPESAIMSVFRTARAIRLLRMLRVL